MIRYSLICDRKHDFEIWFKNSADYDKQATTKRDALGIALIVAGVLLLIWVQ